MIRTLGALVGAADHAGRLAAQFAEAIAAARVRSSRLPQRPKV
jgi:ABC-type hemin transport system substrate-binding protein